MRGVFATRRALPRTWTFNDCIDLNRYDTPTRARIERGDYPEVLYLKPGFEFHPWIDDFQHSDGGGI